MAHSRHVPLSNVLVDRIIWALDVSTVEDAPTWRRGKVRNAPGHPPTEKAKAPRSLWVGGDLRPLRQCAEVEGMIGDNLLAKSDFSRFHGLLEVPLGFSCSSPRGKSPSKDTVVEVKFGPWIEFSLVDLSMCVCEALGSLPLAVDLVLQVDLGDVCAILYQASMLCGKSH